MKKIQAVLFLLLISNLYGQETFSEFDKSNEGIEIEKIKNSDLKLIKEIYRDKAGQVLKYYNYDPQTGDLDGDFDNGICKGTYKNNLITSENYVHFINPSASNNVLIVKGKLISGKFNGKYNIILRNYDTQTRYDPNETLINSYIKGEYKETFARYVNWTKFTDKIVGEITFENGLYSSFSLAVENKKYSAKYKSGILDYYVIKDLSNNRIIDTFKVGGKIYSQNGSFQKNSYPSLVDTINKLKSSPSSECNYELTGFRNINLNYYKEVQAIPQIDPLNFKFDIYQRKITNGLDVLGNDKMTTISYVDKELNKIIFIPITTGGEGKVIIGTGKDGAAFEAYKLPSDLVIVKCISTSDITIPILEYSFNLNQIIDLYGTVKGYKLLNELFTGLSMNKLKTLNQVYSETKSTLTTFTYNDSKILCEKVGQKLFEFDKVKSSNLKSQSDSNAIYAIEAKKKPEYSGGVLEMYKFISRNLQYPYRAREEGISGNCTLRLSIDENGFITNIEVENGVPNCKECDDEAIRVTKKMPKWVPAEVDGKKVSSTTLVPFSYKIQ